MQNADQTRTRGSKANDAEWYLDRVKAARAALVEASTALDQASQFAANYAERGTVAHWKMRVDEIISTDDGEAGIDAVIESIETKGAK